MTRSHQEQGFTLVELMIALVIMVFLGAASVFFLQNIISSRDQLEAREQAMAGMDVGFRVMQEDFQYHLPSRPVRRSTAVSVVDGPEAEYRPLLASQFSRSLQEVLPSLILEERRLELTRSGWYRAPNDNSKGSHLRRIQYQFHPDCSNHFTELPEGVASGCLVRHLVGSLDAMVRDEPSVSQYLFPGVQSLSFEILVINDRQESAWQSSWPSNDSGQARAVRLKLEHSQLGSMERLFVLPEDNQQAWSPDNVAGAILRRGEVMLSERR